MDQYEMDDNKGAEIPSYQQTDDNDARVLQNLGYKQQLNVSQNTLTLEIVRRTLY
jgi:hypothetical protein